MIIEKMRATFGALENAGLELGPGLNIISAPNEAGKSSWCAFLRVMLYGLRTQDRDKLGYLADKTRYRPWSGAPMSGSLELRFQGERWTLQRQSKGAGLMKAFSAVYTGTGEPVPGLHGEGVGELLTGVPEPVFTRSAFIRQAGLGLDRSAELEQRISALVSTGDESGASYGAADAQLREWQRKRYVNRSTGRIAQLDKEIQGAREALDRQQSAGAGWAALRQEQEALRGEIALLRAEKAGLERRASWEKAQERAAQQARVEALQAQIRDLETALDRGGRLLDKADLQQVRTDCAAYQALQVELAARQAQAGAWEEEGRALEEKLEASPYRGKEKEAAREAAAAQLRRFKGAAAVRAYDGKRFALGYVLLALLAALCGGVAIWKFGEMPWYPLAFAVGLGTLAGLFILFLSGLDRKRKKAAAEEECRQILSQAGVERPEDLAAGAEDYIRALEAAEARKQAAQRRGEDLAGLQTEQAALSARLQAELAPFGAGLEDIQAALGRVDAWAARIDELAGLRLSLAGEEKLLARMEALPAAEGPPAPETAPRYDLEETARRLALADGRLRELEKKVSAAQGELRALGDPAVLGAELLRLENARAEQSLQYEALALAVEELAAANTELRSRFSPALSRRAGQIAQALTGGRYAELFFDRDWQAQARLAGESVSRDGLYLSAGTWDQMYLALRLAICELLLGGAEPCPIILDDALSNFDDGRLEKALEWLKTAAAERQVLLFSCQSREADFFEGDGDVRVLRWQGAW